MVMTGHEAKNNSRGDKLAPFKQHSVLHCRHVMDLGHEGLHSCFESYAGKFILQAHKLLVVRVACCEASERRGIVRPPRLTSWHGHQDHYKPLRYFAC